MSDGQPRYIQAWTHSGDSQLIHAIRDDEQQRSSMGLGRLGIYARPVCRRGRHQSFMRPIHSDADRPTYTADGWLDRAGQVGLDWTEGLRSLWHRRCSRCAARLRRLA